MKESVCDKRGWQREPQRREMIEIERGDLKQDTRPIDEDSRPAS